MSYTQVPNISTKPDLMKSQFTDIVTYSTHRIVLSFYFLLLSAAQ
jgi:hypothetical protein